MSACLWNTYKNCCHSLSSLSQEWFHLAVPHLSTGNCSPGLTGHLQNTHIHIYFITNYLKTGLVKWTVSSFPSQPLYFITNVNWPDYSFVPDHPLQIVLQTSQRHTRHTAFRERPCSGSVPHRCIAQGTPEYPANEPAMPNNP